MNGVDDEIQETRKWFADPRFAQITRLYSVAQVLEQRGTLERDYTVARRAAEGFHALMRRR